MIAHALTRRVGGPRVTLDDFARWRDLAAAGGPATLPQVAVDAMTDPDGVTGIVDLSFELESNRNGRPVVSSFVGGGALKDATLMDLADLGSGRKRPSQNVCVADASYADASSVWPSTGAPASDEYPVGLANAGQTTVRNIGLPRPTTLGATTAYSFVNSVGANPQAVTGIDATDPGRLALALEALVWRVNVPSADSWVLYPNLAGGGNNLGSYRLGPDGTRTFTVVLKIVASQAVTVTPFLYGVLAAVPNTWGVVGASKAIAAGAGAFTRIAVTFTATGTPGAVLSSVAPYIVVATTGAARVEFADVQVYAGSERSDAAGTIVSHPQAAVTVEQQFTGTHRFNRIDVTSHEGSIVTATAVEYWTGSAWSLLAVGAASILFPAPLTTTGLRVYIEEVAGYGATVLLTEVDASLVTQLDGDSGVVSASVEWSREADPSQVTSPFGNYQTGKLELELDNTAGLWSPEANANLDVGHRITCAFGVRYTNQLPNPRAELNTVGWTRDTTSAAAVYDRTTDPIDLGTASPGDVATAHRITVAGSSGSISYVYSDPIACAPGDLFDLAGWARMILADPAAAGAAVASITFHSTLTSLHTGVLQRTNAVIASAGGSGDKWTGGQTATVTAPATSVCARVELWCSPQSSPGMTALFTRLRLRKVDTVTGKPIAFETLVPAGVFYSDPFDWSSDADTVQIGASDRLGRNADVNLTEPVRMGQSVGGIVTDLAVQVLDLGVDQVAVNPAVGAYLIPYATPSSNAGGYFADLAKCVAGSLYIDALERLVLERRDNVSTGALAHELRGDNALIRYQRPSGYDLTAASVKLNATPLLPDPNVSQVWAMPSGGFQVPALSSKTIVADYTSSPVVSPFLSGAIADLGGYTLTPAFYADRAEIVVTNPNATTLTLADLRVQGTTLADQALSTIATDALSFQRYANRVLEVDARLVQTQAQLEAVASVLLDAFKALDSNGNRRLPDLILDAMGLLHLEAGDRVIVKNPRTGLGEPFAVLGRTLAYDVGGQILSTGVRVRQSPDVTFMVADLHLSDDVAVAGA